MPDEPVCFLGPRSETCSFLKQSRNGSNVRELGQIQQPPPSEGWGRQKLPGFPLCLSLPPTKLISPIPPFPIDCSLSARPEFAMMDGPMGLASFTSQLANLLGIIHGNGHLRPHPGAHLWIPNVLTPCGHHNGVTGPRLLEWCPLSVFTKIKCFWEKTWPRSAPSPGSHVEGEGAAK